MRWNSAQARGSEPNVIPATVTVTPPHCFDQFSRLWCEVKYM